jgi:predicted  nucleic acid-binding Zn-ribbon protein
MSLDDIKKNLRQFLALKNEIGVLSTRQTELKTRLLNALDSIEPDDKGHRILQVVDEHVGEVRLVKQRRVSKTLDMDLAETILTNKGIKEQCIKLVPTLDEGAIMAAFYEGYLTEEDIDSMFPSKETFAFLVDNK